MMMMMMNDEMMMKRRKNCFDQSLSRLLSRINVQPAACNDVLFSVGHDSGGGANSDNDHDNEHNY